MVFRCYLTVLRHYLFHAMKPLSRLMQRLWPIRDCTRNISVMAVLSHFKTGEVSCKGALYIVSLALVYVHHQNSKHCPSYIHIPTKSASADLSLLTHRDVFTVFCYLFHGRVNKFLVFWEPFGELVYTINFNLNKVFSLFFTIYLSEIALQVSCPEAVHHRHRLMSVFSSSPPLLCPPCTPLSTAHLFPWPLVKVVVFQEHKERGRRATSI